MGKKKTDQKSKEVEIEDLGECIYSPLVKHSI